MKRNPARRLVDALMGVAGAAEAKRRDNPTSRSIDESMREPKAPAADERLWRCGDGVERRLGEMTDEQVLESLRYLFENGATPVQMRGLIDEAQNRRLRQS